jgi:hypothetical protein
MSSSLTLDTLPVEVIQRIAGCSTAESVLNLLKVNRKLHSACDDDLVFKAVIRNGNGHPTATPWNINSFSHTQTGWARLAIADSRARAWPSSKEEIYSDQLSIKNISKWAPQLIALHHPLTVDVPFRRIIQDTPCDEWGVYDFCVVAAITHQLIDGLRNTDGRVDEEVEKRLYEIFEELRNTKYLHSQLACTFVYNTICSNKRPLPPVPHRIPFVELMSLPVPFSELTLLSRSYLPSMTSGLFLTKGEWVGYYSYSKSLHSRERLDPAMEGIHFQAKPHGEIANALDLSASGVDMVGAFTLKGFIRQGGAVEMRKDYVIGGGWDWKANMTPFGIMGSWGAQGHVSGYFWLWKKEWSYV